MAAIKTRFSALPDPKPPDILSNNQPIPRDQLSYAAAVVNGTELGFKKDSNGESSVLEGKKWEWRNGRRSIVFSDEEISDSIGSLSQALIAKFRGTRPSVDVIRPIIKQVLGITGEVFVGVLNSNHLLLCFHRKEDYVKTWMHEMHMMKGQSFRVFPWTPEFRPGYESSLAAVWVSLPLLPCNMFSEKFLTPIVSGVGRLLTLDHSTRCKTRPGAARVCVELDLLKAHPTQVDIVLGKTVLVQEIVYEKKPMFCSTCRLRGHGLSSCPRGKMVVNNIKDDQMGGILKQQKEGKKGNEILEVEKKTAETKKKEEIIKEGKENQGECSSKIIVSNFQQKKRGKTTEVGLKGRSFHCGKETTKQWVTRIFYAKMKKRRKKI